MFVCATACVHYICARVHMCTCVPMECADRKDRHSLVLGATLETHLHYVNTPLQVTNTINHELFKAAAVSAFTTEGALTEKEQDLHR